jgi:CubicO group peptidase (beta-lactamase class C family)
MTTETRFNVQCALKPVLAAAILVEIAKGSMELGDSLRAFLPAAGAVEPSVTLRSLLEHRSGLKDVTLSEVTPNAPGECLEDAVNAQVLSSLTGVPGETAGHSTIVAEWQLLAMVLAVVSGVPADVAVAERVLEPLAMHATSLRPGSITETNRARFFIDGVAVDDSMCDVAEGQSCIPALTGATTMRDLGRLYEAAMGHGRVPHFLSQAFEMMRRQHVTHLGDDRRGLGFNLGLKDHFLPRELTEAAFGYGGQGTAIIALADPGSGIVMAVAFNDLLPPVEGALRRRHAVSALMQSLTDESSEGWRRC